MASVFGLPSALASKTYSATNAAVYNATGSAPVSKYIGYVASIFVVLMIILVFIHYFIKPIFQFNPGGPGIIPVPGLSDGKTYWTQNKDVGPLKENQTILGSQTSNWSMCLDLFIEQPLNMSRDLRILFSRGAPLNPSVEKFQDLGSNQDIPAWFMKVVDTFPNDAKKQAIDSVIKVRSYNLELNENNFEDVIGRFGDESRTVGFALLNSISESEQREFGLKVSGKSRAEHQKIAYQIFGAKLNALINPPMTSDKDVVKTFPIWFMNALEKTTKNNRVKDSVVNSVIKLRTQNILFNENNFKQILDKIIDENRLIAQIIFNSFPEAEQKDYYAKASKLSSRDQEYKLVFKLLGAKLSELLNINDSSIEPLNVSGVNKNSNICIGLLPDTTDLVVYTINTDNNVQFVKVTNVPIQTPFRIGVVLMDMIMEVYVNGMLYKTLKLRSPVKNLQGDFMPPQGQNGNIAKVRNLHIWKRPINASEMRRAEPKLSSTSDFRPTAMSPSNNSCSLETTIVNTFDSTSNAVTCAINSTLGL
jgi:hypothetical protein